jgi:hypothetical protein
MRRHHILASLLPLMLASAAVGQSLDCPAPAGAEARPCDAFHYHVLMYRPDTRAFVEIYGTNQFASMTACERAAKANLTIVDYFKRVRNEQYEADRAGSCHCDMTVEKSSPNYLTDAARLAQIRLAEDIRLRVREHLLDANVTTDSELIRSLAPPLSGNQLLAGSKIVPLPARAAAVENSASDLKSTKVAENTNATISMADLPLVDVSGVPLLPVPVAETPAPKAPQAPAPSAPDDAAENFIQYETQRIQNVLKASSAIADDTVKSKIFEACMQRIQLLSNLRRLVQGSGVRSRLATATRAVRSESERQALAARLFGDDIRAHWAPKDAADVILDARPDVDPDADRVLRDTTGRYSKAQKKRALYVMLGRSQPTEEQQLWLSNVVDSFLQ